MALYPVDRNHMDKKNYEGEHWTKNPMVWMVLFFPALAVVAGIITIIIAVKTDDGLVVDEYYKKGLEINQVIKHDQLAKQYGISALIDTNSQTGEIIISLSSIQTIELPPNLSFKLVHRTIAGFDQKTIVSRIAGSNEYRGYIKPPILEGRWTIILSEDDQWRIKTNFTTKEATHILLNISA